MKTSFKLPELIEYLKNTDKDSWCTDVVRTKDKKNCIMGHVFSFCADEDGEHGGDGWDYFEEVWATTYMIYPVNDGTHPKYQQKTAKDRCLAYLHDLLTGNEKNTLQLMEEDWRKHKLLK